MKSKSLFLLLVASIILISGCVSSFTDGASGDGSKIVLKWETAKSFQESLQNKLSQKALICESSSKCALGRPDMGLFTNNTEQCFFECAIVKEDATWCNEIKKYSGLPENCYTYVAVLKKDSNICDGYPDLVKMCHETLDPLNADKDIKTREDVSRSCDKVSVEKIKNNCKRAANQ